MARKKKEQPTLKFFPFLEDTESLQCSGCLGPAVKDSVYISGNLAGSGVKPFLILCPTCKESLMKWFTDEQIQKMTDNTAKLLSTKNENAVDVAKSQLPKGLI